MIWIYRRASSLGATLLAQAVGGRRWNRRRPNGVKPEDHVVCWGESGGDLNVKSKLNGAVILSKLSEIKKLASSGVPTVEVSMTQKDGWLGRSASHSGGDDLMNPPSHPDYWVRKEKLIREYRVHSFRGESIRAGVKIHRVGYDNPHEWIRSHDGGWRISYDGVSVKQSHRDLAHRAVASLSLQFGAVDIGQRGDGSLIVLEVNRAPGLEGGTIRAYATAIQQWAGRD